MDRNAVIEALEAGKVTHPEIGMVRAYDSWGSFFNSYPSIEEDLKKQLAPVEVEEAVDPVADELAKLRENIERLKPMFAEVKEAVGEDGEE